MAKVIKTINMLSRWTIIRSDLINKAILARKNKWNKIICKQGQ